MGPRSEGIRLPAGRQGTAAKSACEALATSYAKEVTDEFIEPTAIVNEDNEPIGPIADGDGVIFFNFRGDRTREITRAFVMPDFKEFPRNTKPYLYFVCMTNTTRQLWRRWRS